VEEEQEEEQEEEEDLSLKFLTLLQKCYSVNK